MKYKIKRDPIEKIPKVQLVFWLILRVALVGFAFYYFIKGEMILGFEAVFAFIFTHLWDMFQILGNGSFIEDVPPLSQTMLNLIILFGIIFGSYVGLFGKWHNYDNFMHFMTGVVCAVFAYDFAIVIQKKKGECSPTLAALFSIMFALSIALGWEFYEFTMDTVHGTNLQLAHMGPETANVDLTKFNNDVGYYGFIDTFTDMIMNTIGGLLGMVAITIYRNKKPKKNNK